MHPPVDRDLPTADGSDVYVQVTRETDAGIYVSGAKVVATNSASLITTFHRAYRAGADRRPEIRAGLHRADRRARCEAPVPGLQRVPGRSPRVAVRLPVVVASRRERRDSRAR
ncbi:MAG: hypothetical protein R3D59_15360 [Paracoccaceae bacterium]